MSKLCLTKLQSRDISRDFFIIRKTTTYSHVIYYQSVAFVKLSSNIFPIHQKTISTHHNLIMVSLSNLADQLMVGVTMSANTQMAEQDVNICLKNTYFIRWAVVGKTNKPYEKTQ